MAVPIGAPELAPVLAERTPSLVLCTQVCPAARIGALPRLPEFRRVTAADRNWYESAAAALAPYADVTFANGVLWLSAESPLEVSRWDRIPILRYRDPFRGGQVNYLPVAADVPDACFADLLSLARASAGPSACLRDVPARSLKRTARLHVEDDPDSAEYILDVDQQIALEGPAFARTRAKLSRFTRRYGAELNVTPGLSVDQASAEIRYAVQRWPLSKADVPSLEGSVMRRLLGLGFDLGHRALVVRISGQLAAVAVYQVPLPPTFLAVSHLKVAPEIDDLFDFCIHVLAGEAARLNVRLMNLEQDLGIPGIREHKRRLRPAAQLRKLTVRRVVDDTV